MSQPNLFVTPGPGEQAEQNDTERKVVLIQSDDVSVVDNNEQRKLQQSGMHYNHGELFKTAQKQMLRRYEKVACIIADRGSPSIEDQIRGIAVRIGRATRQEQLIELHENGGKNAFLSALSTLKAEDQDYGKFSGKLKDMAFKKKFEDQCLNPHRAKMRKLLACGKFCKQLVEDLAMATE